MPADYRQSQQRRQALTWTFRGPLLPREHLRPVAGSRAGLRVGRAHARVRRRRPRPREGIPPPPARRGRGRARRVLPCS